MWKECNVCNSYLISDDGEVKNKHTGKILKQKFSKDNILRVHLSLGTREESKYFAVHRLVAEAYVPNPDNKPWVRHIDGNFINNEANNLEWTDCKWENTQLQGALAYNSKLTSKQVEYCRKVYKPRDKKYGLSALANKFNVAKSTMSYILNNKTYTAE